MFCSLAQGSPFQESPVCMAAMAKEEQTDGCSRNADGDNEIDMRTEVDNLWSSVFLCALHERCLRNHFL
jgi:hypothetical protein